MDKASMKGCEIFHLQKLGILHPEGSAEHLGLLAERKSAILHGGCLVHKKGDVIASIQDFLNVVDHDSLNLQELET
jgi:hypothetical protein